MRILHCISAMGSGGAERQLTYLAAEQRRQGNVVDIALLYGGPNLERLQQSGANVHFLPARGNHDPRILIRLVRLMRRLRPDVVQTWLTQMDVLGGVAAGLCGVPWVLSERNSELAYPTTAKNQLRELVGARANAIVSNSSGGGRYWQRRARPSAVLREIYNPLPIEEIDTTAPASDEEIGIQHGDKLVLFVGRLRAQKNIEVMIAALAIAARHASFVVRVCGEGDDQAAQRLVEAQGLQSRVRIVGYVSRAWAWMKRANAFISVSRFEGRPNTVLEAAACGCPLVVSDIPSHRETLDDRSALLADPDQPHDIAEALIRTLDRDAATDARVRRAHELVRRLSIRDVEQSYRAVYETVLGNTTANCRSHGSPE